MHRNFGRVRAAFTVDADAVYSPETYLLRGVQDAGTLDHVSELQVCVHVLEAGSQVEVDILKAGGEPSNANDWELAVATYAATGLQTILPLSHWFGVRIRCLSDGTPSEDVPNGTIASVSYFSGS
jgi:hypothetical protein